MVPSSNRREWSCKWEWFRNRRPGMGKQHCRDEWFKRKRRKEVGPERIGPEHWVFSGCCDSIRHTTIVIITWGRFVITMIPIWIQVQTLSPSFMKSFEPCLIVALWITGMRIATNVSSKISIRVVIHSLTQLPTFESGLFDPDKQSASFDPVHSSFCLIHLIPWSCESIIRAIVMSYRRGIPFW